MEVFEALPLMMSDNIFDGVMEEELNPIEDYVEMTHEISTEELDTECMDLLALSLKIVLDVRRRNFWNSWLRYRYRKQQQQGLFSPHVGSEWSDLLSFVCP